MPLYHYTDINAVKSILTSSTMWFTDLRYLNDSKELKEGIGMLLKSFDRWRPGLWTERQYAKDAIAYLKEQLAMAQHGELPDEVQCACSFSRAFDQLSQWRGYGKYIIEFDEKMLQVSWLSVTWTFQPFVINHRERRKADAQAAPQLHPRREGCHPQTALGRSRRGLGSV